MNKEISLNFGAIQESILRLGSREFLSNGRKTLDSFTKMMQENPVLKKQYLIFKSLDTDKVFAKDRLAERFIHQTLEIMRGVSWGDVLRENRECRITYLDNTYVGSTSNKDVLYNAIHVLMECKCLGRGSFDVQREQEAFEVVLEYLLKEKEGNKMIEKQDEPDLSWEYVTKMAVSNFNERYSHLSDSDMKLVKILTTYTNDMKKFVLEDLKKESIKKIHESKNEENKQILESYEKKIQNINLQDFMKIDEAIISCYEFLENLE